MATTTGGTTYVTSTDLVADYPTASLALANRVDVVASGGPNSIKTSGYTITLADILGGNKFLYNSASPGTFTLPTSGLVDGMTVNVAQIGAGALTVSGGTIVGTTVTTAQYQTLQFVYTLTGTTWYSVAPPAVAPGLAIVTPTSIANSGGSASASGGAVTFTGVSSVSLNGVFTSTYDNYVIVTSISGSSDATIRLRAAGSDAASSLYGWAAVSGNQTGTVNGTGGSLATSAQYAYVAGVNSSVITNINSPVLSAFTTWSTSNVQPTTAIKLLAGHYGATTSFDGFTVLGTSQSGIIRVYGYRNS
jgi:hypothetical protein